MYPHNPLAASAVAIAPLSPLIRDRTPFIGTVAMMAGVPAILAEFVWSWHQMVVFNGEQFGPGAIHYDKPFSSYHSNARNYLASHMRGDWLLQLDTDHQFDPDLVWRLVETFEQHKLDVLCGFYQARFHPHPPVLFQYLNDRHPNGEKISEPITGWSKHTPIIQVSAAGGGCLLVRRRVFDAIRRELNEEPFDIRHPWSEDHSFFGRLDRLGIPAYCDTRVECNHLRTVKVTPKDFVREAMGGEPHKREFVEVV